MLLFSSREEKLHWIRASAFSYWELKITKTYVSDHVFVHSLIPELRNFVGHKSDGQVAKMSWAFYLIIAGDKKNPIFL